jgi:glycosyltransferase involved in cell wall biosynthesis
VRYFEAIVHTFLALTKARHYCPDLVHIHAIGPSILAPFARVLGLPVVVTSHGSDYLRKKWGKLAKFVLRVSERIGGAFANEVIVVSEAIGDIMRQRCDREPHVIHNGVNMPKLSKEFAYLTHIGARPRQYILAVARFVPEKGLHDLVDAFRGLDVEHKLVIAGDADHESDYSRKLKRTAMNDDRVILTGYIMGKSLSQVFTHASLYVLPSYHEGLPIALLEAISYGVPVLVSDLSANKEVALPAERYFRAGDIRDLKNKIKTLVKKGLPDDERERLHQQLAEKYDWNKIADSTIEVYHQARGNKMTEPHVKADVIV